MAAMLLVPVRVDRSEIHGLGLFALKPLAAGTPVWRFEPGFDRRFSSDAFQSLPEPAQRHLQHYGYLDAVDGTWVLNGDLTIFMNHSPHPTTGAPPLGPDPAIETIALTDLAAGQELTCDYRTFDAHPKPIR